MDTTTKIEYKPNIELIINPQQHNCYESIYYQMRIGFKRFSLLYNMAPTVNCQIFSIGGIESIFDYIDTRERIMDVIREINRKSNIVKSTCLIDIKEYCFDIIKEEKFIKYSMPYVNKTGSKMVMVLIDALWVKE